MSLRDALAVGRNDRADELNEAEDTSGSTWG